MRASEAASLGLVVVGLRLVPAVSCGVGQDRRPLSGVPPLRTVRVIVATLRQGAVRSSTPSVEAGVVGPKVLGPVRTTAGEACTAVRVLGRGATRPSAVLLLASVTGLVCLRGSGSVTSGSVLA